MNFVIPNLFRNLSITKYYPGRSEKFATQTSQGSTTTIKKSNFYIKVLDVSPLTVYIYIK